MPRSALSPAPGQYDLAWLADWSGAGKGLPTPAELNALPSKDYGTGQFPLERHVFTDALPVLHGNGIDRTVLDLQRPLAEIFGEEPAGGQSPWSDTGGLVTTDGKRLKVIVLEELTLVCQPHAAPAHHMERGWNVLEAYGTPVLARNVRIANADAPIILRRGAHGSRLEDVVFEWPVVTGATKGHHGIRLHGTDRCLIDRLRIQGRQVHDVCLISGSSLNVFRDLEGEDLCIDRHYDATPPHHNLFIRPNFGRCTRPFRSGGSIDTETERDTNTVLWDPRRGDGQPFAGLPGTSTNPNNPDGGVVRKLAVIGFERTEITSDRYLEKIDGALEPADLYLEQGGLAPSGSPSPGPAPSPAPPIGGTMDVTLELTGNPATEPYAVEAKVSGGTPERVEFFRDGAPFRTEKARPYSLFGDAGGVLTKGKLGDGTHRVEARAMAGTAIVGNAALQVVEGAEPAPTIQEQVRAWAKSVGAPDAVADYLAR